MRIELGILEFIQTYLRCDLLDGVMPVITRLGDGGILWICSSLLLLVFPKTRKAGAAVSRCRLRSETRFAGRVPAGSRMLRTVFRVGFRRMRCLRAAPDMRRSVPNAFSGSGTAAVGHMPFAPVGNTGRGEWRMIPGAP